MPSYLAITIGPIYKTLQRATKTREVWVSSYLFSYLMEQILENAKKFGHIILPAVPGEKPKNGAGIFPDRLILELSQTVNENIIEDDVIEPAIATCAKNLSIDKTVLSDYLQIHFLIIGNSDLMSFELNDDDGNSIKSFIHRLNFLLDQKELNFNYTPSTEAVFSTLYKNSLSWFYEAAYGSHSKQFPSILEISAKKKISPEAIELLYKDKLTDDEAKIIDEQIKKLDKSKAYKYLAILRADGDNFGKVIAAISDNPEKLKDFSKRLVQFSAAASTIITKAGGTVIYIGGDDILCFTPVLNENNSVFTLIDELNNAFYKVFDSPEYKDKKVAMSYGLSITYYKYPLNEALQLSYDLLFYNAKKTPGKNCLCFQLLQHSGQFRKITLSFGKQYNSFLKMRDDFADKDEMLQSLTHQFAEDKVLLTEVLKNNDRLNGYFENHFSIDEKDARLTNFINSVRENTVSTYDYMKNLKSNLKDEKKKNDFNTEDETLNQLNTICRTMKFLTEEHA